ncbi:FYN-binding protein 1 isoform X2 [Myripristis murdjan]|uniref:FYN-binding protein 1 isoform X2 n=1 Tax=Myripristis murdjan TaxID=586833 RepID=UPI001175F39D|nr:FYN-binding protein 1-like isoform X2 [Myripristis murdjan]
MEEEGPINFKALRAKFQEEAILAQTKTSRPAVAEKPKHLPPPGGHCSSVVSGINIAVENKTPVVPRVIFRDGLRASEGKRPISYPPQLQQISPPSRLGGGDGTTKQSLKDRHMPLVLPVPPVKEQNTEPPAAKEHKPEPEPQREVLPQTKIKKKGLLLPFKSTKATKVTVESREEPTYADLTIRPASAPGELPSMDRQRPEDGISLQGDSSTMERPPSSPDIPITPPSTESGESDNRISSTLERAKKKFSRRQLLIYAKPKSFRSTDKNSTDKAAASPPKDVQSTEPEVSMPPPVCLPHLACISARPFFKANGSARTSTLDKQFCKDRVELPSVRCDEPLRPSTPPKKPLPDLSAIGPSPVKPPRPPRVDLSCHRQAAIQKVSPGLSHAPSEEPASEQTSISNPVLDAPEFPDFENSEVETAEGEAIDIAALELEAFDLVSFEHPGPADFGVSHFGDLQPDLQVSEPPESTSFSLNLDSQSLIPPDPAGLPDPLNLSELPEPVVPELWSRSEEGIVPPPPPPPEPQTDLAASELQSVTEETDHGNHAALNDTQPQSDVCQQDSCYEACNVYEDVENINKFISGLNSRKCKGGPKNPYADNHPVREEARLNIWPRNPWGSISGEHNHSTHTRVHSPDTADYKEQKKKEKQRLEKEKKELKEREKKENEMKKKFKVTGEEEPMYHAKVMVASKVRKNDLPVKSGDTVSIIRTTNCPKGKWLARDANHKYGYISVMNVELNIKEMLELGKKAQAAGRGGNMEGDTISIGSRSSSHPIMTSSFTDDSEEWAYEDETISPSADSHFQQRTDSMPEMSSGHTSALHTLSDANPEDLHTQTRHEALQKLAIFLQHNKDEFSDNGESTPTNTEPPGFLCVVEEPLYPDQEVDFTDLELLPPPPLYADTF